MEREVTYRAPTYEPTVDELEALKRLEMGERVTTAEALHDHQSHRLLEWGLVTKLDDGRFGITEAGRQQIRRGSD